MSDLQDDPSPEATFLRELVRAEEADLPSTDKMNELVARLAPAISKAPASVSRAKIALSSVVVVAITGAWLTTSWRSDIEHKIASAPSPTVSIATTAALAVAPSAAEVLADSPAALPSINVSALPSTATPARPSRIGVPSSDGCTGEVGLLDQAGAALRSGEADRALSLTREHAARCPSGAFTQERERIAIESLAKLGRIDEMRTRAQAFERNFPASPHLRRIERVVEKYRDR